MVDAPQPATSRLRRTGSQGQKPIDKNNPLYPRRGVRYHNYLYFLSFVLGELDEALCTHPRRRLRPDLGVRAMLFFLCEGNGMSGETGTIRYVHPPY